MVTACDKAITLWDLVSLQVISTLKAHKDEVRVLHINNDLLYSAGKGGASASSIFSWDFRSTNPLYEAERNQDIFSLVLNHII
jgi:WD40 repeat protein